MQIENYGNLTAMSHKLRTKSAWRHCGEGEPPFDGSACVEDTGMFKIDAFKQGNVIAEFSEITCNGFDLTPGCSGGPWLQYYGNQPRGKIILNSFPHCYIVGITSHNISNKSGYIYSPFLGEEFNMFFDGVISNNPIEIIA